MLVIGFQWPVEHDHSVAVIQNGRLIFAVEEERFTRHKHSVYEPSLFSLEAAFRFLKKQGIKPKDVDAYAVNWDSSLFTAEDRRIRAYVFSVIGNFTRGILSGKRFTHYAFNFLKRVIILI